MFHQLGSNGHDEAVCTHLSEEGDELCGEALDYQSIFYQTLSLSLGSGRDPSASELQGSTFNKLAAADVDSKKLKLISI